jgi:hypothetical protein
VVRRRTTLMQRKGGTFTVVPAPFAEAMGCRPGLMTNARWTVVEAASGPVRPVLRLDPIDASAKGSSDVRMVTSRPARTAGGKVLRGSATVVRIPSALAAALKMQRGSTLTWTFLGPELYFIVEW